MKVIAQLVVKVLATHLVPQTAMLMRLGQPINVVIFNLNKLIKINQLKIQTKKFTVFAI